MTTPDRVSEEEAEAASLILSTLADNRYREARGVLLRLLAERAALEAKIADLEIKFARAVGRFGEAVGENQKNLVNAATATSLATELARKLAEARREFAREALDRNLAIWRDSTLPVVDKPYKLNDWLRREAGREG